MIFLLNLPVDTCLRMPLGTSSPMKKLGWWVWMVRVNLPYCDWFLAITNCEREHCLNHPIWELGFWIRICWVWMLAIVFATWFWAAGKIWCIWNQKLIDWFKKSRLSTTMLRCSVWRMPRSVLAHWVATNGMLKAIKFWKVWDFPRAVWTVRWGNFLVDGGCARCWGNCCCRPLICCCWMSLRTTWIYPRFSGWRITWPIMKGHMWLYLTIRISWIERWIE